MSNENMEENPQHRNGTVCRLVSVKIEDRADINKWKNSAAQTSLSIQKT
jgi:hypothetical protein